MNLLHFLAECDLARPPEEIALELIALTTGVPVTAETVVLGELQVVSNPQAGADDTTVNVAVTLQGALAEDYPGVESLSYHRIPLYWVTRDQVLLFDRPRPFTTHDVLDELNARLGVQFTVDDLENDTYTDRRYIRLRAKPGSLVWCNIAYPHHGPYFTVSHDAERIPAAVKPPLPFGGDGWVPGQTDFLFDSTPYTPTPNFEF